MREIILDVETTGLDPSNGHRVIEVALVELVDKILTGKKIHYYINPERDIPEDSYKIHGISAEFLKDKPLFKEIASELMNFIQDTKLVIHNAPFDMKFLNYELTLLSLPSINPIEVIDTLIMAKKTFPGSRVNLDALCKRFKVDSSHRKFHGALKDAYLLSEVYIELLGGRQISFFLKEEDNNIPTLQKDVQHFHKYNRRVLAPTISELRKHSTFISKLYKLKQSINTNENS